MTVQTYQQYAKDEFKTLDTYTKAIAKVHGPEHPEIIEVRSLFETIQAKTKAADKDGIKADLSAEFAKIRELTGDYQVPANTCETTIASYEMLRQADQLYHFSPEDAHLKA